MIQTLNTWQFHNPVKIFAGRDSRSQLVSQLKNKTLLIVTTKRGKTQFLGDPVYQK